MPEPCVFVHITRLDSSSGGVGWRLVWLYRGILSLKAMKGPNPRSPTASLAQGSRGRGSVISRVSSSGLDRALPFTARFLTRFCAEHSEELRFAAKAEPQFENNFTECWGDRGLTTKMNFGWDLQLYLPSRVEPRHLRSQLVFSLRERGSA